MTAYELLCRVPHLPRMKPEPGQPSKSEIRRMLDQHAVRINGVKPGWKDEIEMPVWDLTFFVGAQRQCSMVWRSPLDALRDEFNDVVRDICDDAKLQLACSDAMNPGVGSWTHNPK